MVYSVDAPVGHKVYNVDTSIDTTINTPIDATVDTSDEMFDPSIDNFVLIKSNVSTIDYSTIALT